MASTAFLAPLTDSRLVRRAADAVLLRYAHHRTAQLNRMDVAAVQRNTLIRLVRKAKRTQFGRDHDFSRIRSIADYQARVPVRAYEWFWDTYWKNAFPRIDNLTWPGKIPYYALSSGTTSGATKYVPVSWEMVASNKKAGFTTTALFRHANPGAKLFTGKFFFLGGSTDLRRQDDGSLAGDLSGIASRELLELLRPYTFPPRDLTLITNWEEKVRRFAELSAREPITALSGIPAWMHVLFTRLKEVTGKSTIAEIWPDLRLIVHGGTKFDPYRELFKKEIGSDLVKFCEVYPCSEGFVATEDPQYQHLRVVPDHDIFFEFVPVGELGQDRPTRHTLANVEVGVQYAVVLTSCAGVWSYLVGDTVAFERRDPPLIRFTGRTKYFLSAFGEHLISEEVEAAVARAASVCGVVAVDFHVGPVFPAVPGKAGHHLYLVEFAEGRPDLARFAKEIDDELNRINEDYGPHRVGDLAMLMPEVRVVKPGGFAEWMKARGKYGGQNKVPRMDNSGAMTKDMANWFENNGWAG
ncbi:GH3 auxin-responsive promoter family protein [Gemmata sp. JC717]|uniref:GH3 auxin-responsive promoter family protein n=1 Tax=Gemmata algarum TaxID=2975278 RepID=UPI0021BA80A2|nr:GH3 auxin-responsive promoter family protein [Gemmata algarum]MDY3551885.1 GH3 auxin-responsive promoter family protein [Gemmata algarum]